MRYLPLAAALLLALVAPAAAQPDLNGNELLFPDPARVDPGDSFELAFTVANSGTEPSSSFGIAFYFSTDRFLSDDDVFLTRIPFDGVGVQQSVSASITLTTPDVPRGGYFVIVSIDDPDVVAETDETNNLSYGELTVGGDADGPDLTIFGGELEDETAEPGDRISLEYTVANVGGSGVGDFEVGYYLAPRNPVPPPSEWIFLEREVLGGLDAGENEDESEQVTLPDDLAPGDYSFVVIADDRNLIEERNETNNELGIGILTVTTTTAVEGTPTKPGLRLSTWPNPASETLRLRYDLAETASVRLAVYDVLGREVVTITGGLTSGSHEATLDLSTLPAGRYTVVLDAGGERATAALSVTR